jgi:3',5'-cyclic AMP phosphodiesterase CpdA
MCHLIALFLILWIAGMTLARAAVLVALDDEWRYANSTNLSPGAAWTGVGFPDGSWRTGRSGFGTSSYGEQTHFTSLAGNWRNMVFRRRFEGRNPQELGTLILRIDHRDGFVAYLNQREIGRRGFNLPTDVPVPLDAFPNPRLAGYPEEIRIGLAGDFLVAGTNILAIQVHSDSDYERPVLVPELISDFTRGPYLQSSGSNAMTILWRTAEAHPGHLYLGTTTNPPLFAEIPVGTNQSWTVRDLIPGQRYHYAVALLPPGKAEIRSETFSFRALPDHGPLKVAVFGDSGAGTSGQFSVARALAATDVDLVIHAGDVIYPAFSDGLADVRLLSVYRRHIATTPYAFAWGNHDLLYGTGHMRSVIRPPTNNTPSGLHQAEGTTPESYYSFDAGEVHIAVVFQPYLSQYTLRTNSAQYAWLDADLGASKKPWKMILAHHPIATSGGHRFTDINANGIADWQEFSAVLLPLAQKHGVQLFLSGHDHLYERFLPQQGLHAVITGGGGASLYFLRGYDAISAQLHITHHFTRLQFDLETLRVRAVYPNGNNFDGFNIQRTPPPQQPHFAQWFTPVVETAPASNGDGNITGQQYDLYNAPEIRPLTGRFANLGRARVALDRTHLHLGLEFVMLPSDSDAYVFLEMPGLPGVTSMAGLGNGVPDPAGEGVDALDGIENLSFGNFRPSIAAVLGDESADGNFRGFKRPGHSSGLGQGVFRLQPGFPDVPGVRIQQFNRSPQDNVAPPEQNADFIEVSIPRSQLGSLVAGRTIRLAVVAAGEPDPIRQTRRFDTGFAGSSYQSDGHAPATLEGLVIQLPPDPDPDDDGLTASQEILHGTDPNNADTDGDGLPDGWEVAHGLKPLIAAGADGAEGDPDRDGFDNRVEFELGTSPGNALLPAFQIEASDLADGRIVLRWPVPLGEVDLQQSPGITGPWTSLPGFPRTASVTKDELIQPTGNAPAFFRVQRP